MNDAMNERMWQEAALYRALVRVEGKQVFDVTSPEDFLPGPHQDLAYVAHRYRDVEDPANSAMAEMVRTGNDGGRTLLAQIVSDGFAYLGSGSFYAREVAELASKRRVQAMLTRMEQAIGRLSGDDWWAAKDAFIEDLSNVVPPVGDDGDDYRDLDYFMTLREEDAPFTFPGMLKRNERWLMVGKEGGGKSALVYQMLTGAAFGVDTLSYDFAHYQPQRVVFLDVENSEHQVAFNVRTVAHHLREMRPDVEPFWRSLKRRVVDLTDRAQAVHVIRSVVKHNPDILYMGTAYKLAFDADYRVMGRAIMDTIDRIRAEVGCSVLVEHHAGHGDKNNRNGWRADGTSEWGRWPDFARGMDVKVRPNGQRVMKLIVSSRMDRSAGRHWPVGMVQGALFPWVPIFDEVEFDESYGSLFPQQAA